MKIFNTLILGGLIISGTAFADVIITSEKSENPASTENKTLVVEQTNTENKTENGVKIQVKTIVGPTVKHSLDKQKYYQDSKDNVKRVPLSTESFESCQ